MAKNITNTGGSVHVKFNHLPAIANAIPGLASDLIGKALQDTAARALPLTPVVTGHLKNSQHMSYKPGDLHGSISWGADYAAFVNFGTRFMDPRAPGPATKGFATQAVTEVVAALGPEIDKIAKAIEDAE